jgi:hypothetical protein
MRRLLIVLLCSVVVLWAEFCRPLRYTLAAPLGAAVPTGMSIDAVGVIRWAQALPGSYPLIV